jgi:Cu-Zn family superoxide dismutase
MRNLWKTGLCTLALLTLAIGCNDNHPGNNVSQSQETKIPADNSAHDEVVIAVANIHPSQAATTQPAMSQITGQVVFTSTDEGVKVVAELHGFKPGSTHGFHIHENGDLSAPNLSSAGGHFNPDKHQHGGPRSAAAHAGDLGNIVADAQGNAHLEITLHGLTLTKGPRGLIDRSVIVHADADDLKTDPAGNAGPRIAGGVIELRGS